MRRYLKLFSDQDLLSALSTKGLSLLDIDEFMDYLEKNFCADCGMSWDTINDMYFEWRTNANLSDEHS